MDNMNIEEYRLPVYRDCSDELNDWKVFSFSLSYDGSFVFAMTKEDVDYCRIIHFNGENGHSDEIKVKKLDLQVKTGQTTVAEWYRFVQLLPDNEFLLLASRCNRYKDGTADHNGLIINQTGHVMSRLVFGDGINNVQTDKNGFIWTSYFDEGIFGNYGWDYTIGHSGLVKWNKKGIKVYEYTPNYSALDRIADCYAMNVVNEEDVWICYYSQFPFVKISNQTVTNYWLHEFSFITTLLVDGNKLLVKTNHRRDNVYLLLQLNDEHNDVKCLRKLRFTFENDKVTDVLRRCSYRDTKMAFLKNNKLYLFDLTKL